MHVVSPSGRHDGALSHIPLVVLQVRPVQQSVGPLQVCPAVMHADIIWQVPPVHAAPEQQSLVFWQVCPVGRHAHVPPVHNIEPQQSALDAHESD